MKTLDIIEDIIINHNPCKLPYIKHNHIISDTESDSETTD